METVLFGKRVTSLQNNRGNGWKWPFPLLVSQRQSCNEESLDSMASTGDAVHVAILSFRPSGEPRGRLLCIMLTCVCEEISLKVMLDIHKGLSGSWVLSICLDRYWLLELLALPEGPPTCSHRCLLPVRWTVFGGFSVPQTRGYGACSCPTIKIVSDVVLCEENCLFCISKFKLIFHLD